MMAILMALAYLNSISLGFRLKFRVFMRHILRAARRVLGVPDFRLYALADGIEHFLFSQSKGLKPALPRPNPSPFKDSTLTYEISGVTSESCQAIDNSTVRKHYSFVGRRNIPTKHVVKDVFSPGLTRPHKSLK